MQGVRDTYEELGDLFCSIDPGRTASILEAFDEKDVAAFLDSQPPKVCAQVLGRLSNAQAAGVLASLDPAVLNAAMAQSDLNALAIRISRLSTSERENILERIDTRDRKELEALLEYPPDSAGSMMDTRVAAFREHTAVANVRETLKAFHDRQVMNVFVVDELGKLVGKVPLQELALCDADDLLGPLVQSEPYSTEVFSPQEEIIELLNRERLSSIPVIDFEGRLLGVIRNETLMQAAQEEAIANVQAMFGAGREERALSPVLFAVQKRLPWLEVNLLTAFLAAAVVGLFEDTIAQFTALAVLLPVVAGQSGNTGAQALAVTMRGLAIREIRVRDWFRLLWKEGGVALINGIAVALTTALGVYLWSRSLGLALIIGSSMVISMAAAGVAGASVPLVLTSLRQDPAQSSSIILTTITDVVGFFSFLGIATLLMGMLTPG